MIIKARFLATANLRKMLTGIFIIGDWSIGVVECWSRKTHHSSTPSLQLPHFGHKRLRIHDHAEVLVEIVECRLLLLPSERCIAVRQEQDFEIPHGAVAGCAVGAG